MNDIRNILFVLNPQSQYGRGFSVWKIAKKRYPQLPKQPRDMLKEDIEDLIIKTKPKIIVVAGGDGAINYICRIVYKLKQKPTLSILPLGTGNAFSYCLGVETIDKAMEVLSKREKQITIDLIKTNIPGHEIGVINTSVGIDARIVLHRQDYRYIGWGAYFVSGLRSLFFHPEEEITFVVDHKVTLSAKASSLFIANAPVIGLNYLVSPHAKLNDGFLDCTLFSTKYAFFRNLRFRGFKHPFYTELGKVRFKASHIRIEGNPFIQIDGDPVMHKGVIEIEIMPSQITFLRNDEENIEQEYMPFNV